MNAICQVSVRVDWVEAIELPRGLKRKSIRLRFRILRVCFFVWVEKMARALSLFLWSRIPWFRRWSHRSAPSQFSFLTQPLQRIFLPAEKPWLAWGHTCFPVSSKIWSLSEWLPQRSEVESLLPIRRNKTLPLRQRPWSLVSNAVTRLLDLKKAVCNMHNWR